MNIVVRFVQVVQYVQHETGSGDMTRLSASKLRDALADTLNRVAYGGERILLHRRGQDLAALISKDDLALFEELEDRSDAILAHEALAEAGTVPWEKVKDHLGL